MLASDVASRELGIELLDLSPGRARVSMRVTASMVNGHAITHGGFVFALADTAFALACNSYDEPAVAARADIRFLRPTHEGDVLIADAVERARFGRNGIYDVAVSRDGEVVAEFRGDSRTIAPRQ
ncbi:hydroxyphenylacetyl-CoA thioesterase PaaI [Skermania sp. ID1734]|uniref:hydroxyphenylacetyl-CoA thioesterase PaaI n=1 Tax=Skermania sp. ID1734 TaxID=2597516 RepID=UPI00117E6DCF|nr:hydroxyphenylacetyl-CoA thioesterase PaaI [Skermania sp. ID1734]TSE00161.1 hydroxyphenylacetyl-CoA thioesterase PaaI [Skermania sp. ID1734]